MKIYALNIENIDSINRITEIIENQNIIVNKYQVDFVVPNKELLEQSNSLAIFIDDKSNIDDFMFTIGYAKGNNLEVIIVNQSNKSNDEIAEYSIYLSKSNITYLNSLEEFENYINQKEN